MLTKRLDCIINYIDTDTVADIGTDHGYAATELIKRGRAKRVIAADVRQGPLNAAIENIKKYGMTDRIETRLGSGLSVLKPYEADTAIIAGMGGELIWEIIRADIDTARSMELILQPMNSQCELRKLLINNGFTIAKEDIVCESERVYNVLIVRNGTQQSFQNELEYHIPSCLKSHPMYHMLYNKKKREFMKIVNGLENSNDKDEEKLGYYRDLLAVLLKIRKETDI